MEAKIKHDLLKIAVASGVSAGCFVVSPGLRDIFMTYGKDIADVIAIIAQAFGASGLIVMTIRIIPYIYHFIKYGLDSLRREGIQKGSNSSSFQKEKTDKLGRGLAKANSKNEQKDSPVRIKQSSRRVVLRATTKSEKGKQIS
ncbi:MAG: hypothetical protein J6Y85_00440 [Alphaproteobacteria bacterium]|nr:hypothetical protein [Alphaproteobacteria bacterium]